MPQVLGLLLAFAAVLGVLFVLWKPRWAVLVIIVMFPLEQLLQSYIGYFRTHNTHLNLLVGFLALFAVLSRLMHGERMSPGLLNPASVCYLLLIVWCWVGLLWSPSRELGKSHMDAALPYVGLFFICMPLLLDDLYDFRRLALGVLILGSAITALIILNPRAIFQGGRFYLDLDRSGDVQSNPLAIANLGGSMALIAVLIRVERGAKVLTIFRAAAFLCGFGLAILSGSRGQVIAAGIVAVAIYPLARRVNDTKQFFLTAGGLGVVGLAILGVFRLFVGYENRERWDLGDAMQDTVGRFDMAFALLLEWMSTPSRWLHGLGTNAFTTVTPFGGTPYVHNAIVEAFAELGLIGGVLILVLIYWTFRSGIRLWRAYQDDPMMRSLAAVLLAQAAYGLLLMFKQGSIVAHPYGLMWWIILSGISAHEDRRLSALGSGYETRTFADPLDAAEHDPYCDDGSEYDDYILAP